MLTLYATLTSRDDDGCAYTEPSGPSHIANSLINATSTRSISVVRRYYIVYGNDADVTHFGRVEVG